MYINYISQYFPENRESNQQVIGDSTAWSSEKVLEKLGIASRHVAGGTSVSEMVTKAAEKLFAVHPELRESIDGLILCTQSPDYLLPTTACVVQSALKLGKEVAAFDINLGCSGYIYSLALAKGFIASGIRKKVLIVTGDLYTSHLAPDDIANRLIFGDGATATVVSNQGDGLAMEVLDFDLGTDGSGQKNLISMRGGMKKSEDEGFLYMNGPEVFNFTMKEVPGLVAKNLARNNLDSESISYYIFHQANKFMLESLRKKIKISEQKWLTHFENCGNTVSSTIPIVLAEFGQKEFFKHGDTIQLVGFGVGYSWGAVVLRKN